MLGFLFLWVAWGLRSVGEVEFSGLYGLRSFLFGGWGVGVILVFVYRFLRVVSFGLIDCGWNGSLLFSSGWFGYFFILELRVCRVRGRGDGLGDVEYSFLYVVLV